MKVVHAVYRDNSRIDRRLTNAQPHGQPQQVMLSRQSFDDNPTSSAEPEVDQPKSMLYGHAVADGAAIAVERGQPKGAVFALGSHLGQVVRRRDATDAMEAQTIVGQTIERFWRRAWSLASTPSHHRVSERDSVVPARKNDAAVGILANFEGDAFRCAASPMKAPFAAVDEQRTPIFGEL